MNRIGPHTNSRDWHHSRTRSGRPLVEGVVVAQTTPGSPAERAGLLGANAATGTTGDVIVRVNGQPIKSIYDLTAQLEHVGLGQRIQLGVERNGRLLQIEVEIIDIGNGPAVSALDPKR